LCRTDGWKIFTGDQLGAIFAGRVLDVWRIAEKPLGLYQGACASSFVLTANSGKLAMVASTVSSKLLEKMAEVEKFKFVECLTGTPSFLYPRLVKYILCRLQIHWKHCIKPGCGRV
jgi:phosphomannomutase